ncbi:hypothetical protein RND81_09G227300 [Saponaria officinalis]|uniref:Cyclin-like domain-containing protein n=1 Tax=Saponaria officinalis TaxID=3572 RepID=A0AAW1IPP1_SAPOF
MKRKSVEQVTTASAAAEFTTRNLRSKIPRRKRSHISPIIVNSETDKVCELKFYSVSNCDEVSCNTTLESVVLPANDATRVKNEGVVPKNGGQQKVLVSENSCVESCSVVVAEVDSNRNGAVSFSVAQHSPADTSATVDQKTLEKFSGGYDVVGDELACDESLSYDDYEVTSAAESFSELQSEIFSSSNGKDANSQLEDFTDEYTPSIWLNSGSQFSEKSYDDDSAPSPCFSLFKEFKQQFLILNSDCADDDDHHYIEEIAYWTFEEEEYEESYKLLRSRERKQAAKVTNYIEEYHNETIFGGVIVEQRLVMVNWIIQLSRKKDLNSETMFLGVRLFDRFLSKGCFTSKRNLQILGIACLTLAIRIEENQPYNSVRQKCFYVGSNIYSRTEIVAMEWVVQEVLNFHCISTTIYNFLWFYLKAAGANEQMQKKAEHLASLTLLDHMQLRFWPSSVAAALVILVSLSAERDESCQRVMEVHVRTKIDDLPECIKSLEWLVQHAL